MSNYNPISLLNELGPTVKVTYEYEPCDEEFMCIAKAYKDREVFDCYGISRRKQDAKYIAANQLVAILKLVFPVIPIAIFNDSSPLTTEWSRIESMLPIDMLIGFHLYEIKSGNIYVLIDPSSRLYMIILNSLPKCQIVTSYCPIKLLNDPIRFTDWSKGPICQAQENYINKRVELWYLN